MSATQRHTYRVDLAYLGAGFAGYARQPGLRTIEGCLHEALWPLLPSTQQRFNIRVAGRTDRGVNATHQVISFWCREEISSLQLADAIDNVAPGEIACGAVREVSRSFHAQFSAQARCYTYLQPAENHDCDRIAVLLQALRGTHDFHAFARDTVPGKSTVRRLEETNARICRHDGATVLRLDFRGRSFLRRQVRIMVSTVLALAARRADPTDVLRLLYARDRLQTTPAAPAEHLYLTKVLYDPVALK